MSFKDVSSAMLPVAHVPMFMFDLAIMMKKDDPVKSFRTIIVPSSGYTLMLNEDDITVNFPTGFISQPSLSFDYNVMIPELFGPECFPPGVRPVSALLELHPHNSIEFEKPLEITIPHFTDLETEEDCRRLKAFKACPDNRNGQTVWNFKEISQDKATLSLFTVRDTTNDGTKSKTQYASFSSEHCCIFCIGEIKERDTDKATFCLTRAQKLTNDSREVTLHYCLYYDLPTCRKVFLIA